MDFDVTHLSLSKSYTKHHFDIKIIIGPHICQFFKFQTKSVQDWQKKNDNSYVWAWKLGIQRELFDEYLSKSEITQGN